MENPYQMPREGGGWDRESAAEWHFPELAWPFFAQAPKAEESDPDPSQRAPGAAHSLAAWLANHRLGYLPQTGASLLPASCPLASCAPRLLSVLLGCAPEAEVMDNKQGSPQVPQSRYPTLFVPSVTQSSVARTLGWTERVKLRLSPSEGRGLEPETPQDLLRILWSVMPPPHDLRG